jgi:glutathione synthase/RimK-type ligase-like ATP-grasp enzyme
MGVRIAVALDPGERWHERFALALTEARAARHPLLEFEVVNLERHDWIRQLERFDAVLWKSSVMGVDAASRWKEKVYFTETHLQKLVFPSFKTIWHFESKIAQSFLFARNLIPTPRTFASGDYEDAAAALEDWVPPLVFKKSDGAASSNVWKVATRAEARGVVERTFAANLWGRAVGSTPSTTQRLVTAARNIGKGWLWRQVADRVLGHERWSSVYWQEFVAGNPADLRITVIGGRVAAHYWRRNRPHDFRASGSGMIDFERPAPEHVVRACIDLARRLEFDTMAFDVLFQGEQHLFVEMSYGYVDRYVAKVSTLFELVDGTLRTIPGGRWPQELWVDALLAKLEQSSATGAR